MGGESLILLDTHCLIWMDQADTRMGGSARDLADAAIETTELAISMISFWEVAWLVARGRLRVRGPVARWRRELLERGIVELPLGGRTCIAAAQLEDFHADPADRFIVASAQAIGATLVTADRRILTWMGPLDRHDARF
ncbi:MAG: type II toxin-antitoxin system VapC family toxin [Geminicoccaceae bacterium]